MTALSPLRSGRITASRVGAILGVDPYKTRADVLREMVRDHFGAEPEFTGNDATEWGNTHEEDARSAYEQRTGKLVLAEQEFLTHPEHDWMGCSPDGLVGDDGMAEFKCPMRARYTSIGERPAYYAQVQFQLAVSGREWCHFVIWRQSESLIIDAVARDDAWLGEHLETLTAFILEFREVIADEKLAAPHLAPLEVTRDDTEWAEAAARYRELDDQVVELGKQLDAAKKHLIALAGDVTTRGCGVDVVRSVRSGSVDWKRLAEKNAPDVDAGEYRKPSSVVWTVR